MDYFHSFDTITFENKLHLVRSLAQFNAFRINTGPGLIESAHAIGVKLLSLVESHISGDVKSAHHNNSSLPACPHNFEIKIARCRCKAV